jgi:beta-lactamase regulating signal transducer with metallopeptidase domain
MSEWIVAVNAFAAAWAGAMGRASWQGAVALALAWGTASCNGRHHGSVRPILPGGAQCWIWRLAYLKLLVALLWSTPVSLPLLRAAGSASARPALPVAAPSGGRLLPLPPSLSSSSAIGGEVSPDRAAPILPSRRQHAPMVFLGLWSLGVTGCALRTAAQWRRARCLSQRYTPVPGGLLTESFTELCRRLRLRQVPRLVTCGAGPPRCAAAPHPTVILPLALLAVATPQELRLVLAHELAHLKRRDLLWSWLPVLAHCLFFFHPLVWLARRQWRLAQEMACDEMTVRVTDTPAGDYGELLVKLTAQRRQRERRGFGAVGALEPGAALERRLSMLKFIASRTRKQQLAAGIMVAGLAMIGLIPWRVSAQSEAAPDTSASLAQKWEDVLLLDAMRYLRLSPAQLQRMQPLAGTAEGRLTRLSEKEEKTRAALDRIAQKQRQALVRGERVSLQEQSDALLMEQAMRQRREQAAEDIVRSVAPQLARILTREQIVRAFLLAHGEMPPQVARRPALLDPGSGFVLDASELERGRVEAIQQVLRRRYPSRLVQASLVYGIKAQRADADPIGSADGIAPGDVVLSLDDPDPQTLEQFPAGVREAYMRDRRALQERSDYLAQAFITGASEDDLVTCLRPLVRRLFLSPRLKPVLIEALRSGVAFR